MIPAVLPPPTHTKSSENRGRDGSTDADFDDVLAHVGLDSADTPDESHVDEPPSDDIPPPHGPGRSLDAHRPEESPRGKGGAPVEEVEGSERSEELPADAAAGHAADADVGAAASPPADATTAPATTEQAAVAGPVEAGHGGATTSPAPTSDGTDHAGESITGAAAGGPGAPAETHATPDGDAPVLDPDGPVAADEPGATGPARTERVAAEPVDGEGQPDGAVPADETVADAGPDTPGGDDAAAEPTADSDLDVSPDATHDRGVEKDPTESGLDGRGDEVPDPDDSPAAERSTRSARAQDPRGTPNPAHGPPDVPPASNAARQAPGVARVTERGLADLPFVAVADDASPEPTPAAGLTAAPTPATAPPSTAPTAPAPPAPGSPPVVDQLVDHVSPLLDGPDGTHELSIELRPAELGRVVLEVSLDDGVVHVKVHADDAVSRRLLTDALPELRQALERGGVRAGDLDVGNGAGDRSGDRTRGDDRPGRGEQRPSPERRPDHVPTRPSRRDVALDVLL